jgi:Acetyltransferases, including N-acetylases of ribosomal proteins
MTEFPVLQSPRCVLNRITEEDIPVMRQIFDDGLTRKYLSELWTLVETDDGIKQMLSSFNLLMKQNEGLIWGVRLNGNLIAFVAFMDLSCNPTVIYAMHPAYRSKGYLKECVAQSVQYILDSGMCSYMQTEVHNDNVASVKLLQSIGFDVVSKDELKTYLQKGTPK